jgi:hypothetical protein
VGSFAAGTPYKFSDFLDAFYFHLRQKQGLNYVVLDMRGLTLTDRMTMMSKIIPSLSSAERARLIILSW